MTEKIFGSFGKIGAAVLQSEDPFWYVLHVGAFTTRNFWIRNCDHEVTSLLFLKQELISWDWTASTARISASRRCGWWKKHSTWKTCIHSWWSRLWASTDLKLRTWKEGTMNCRNFLTVSAQKFTTFPRLLCINLERKPDKGFVFFATLCANTSGDKPKKTAWTNCHWNATPQLAQHKTPLSTTSLQTMVHFRSGTQTADQIRLQTLRQRCLWTGSQIHRRLLWIWALSYQGGGRRGEIFLWGLVQLNHMNFLE